MFSIPKLDRAADAAGHAPSHQQFQDSREQLHHSSDEMFLVSRHHVKVVLAFHLQVHGSPGMSVELAYFGVHDPFHAGTWITKQSVHVHATGCAM